MLWAVHFCQCFRAQGRCSRIQCEGSRFTATDFSQSHLQQVSVQIRLSLPGDAHSAFSTPFGLDGAWQCCEATAWRMQHCKHPQCSLRGSQPSDQPQHGDGPQGPYKPAINPQIRDIKAGTAGKSGLIYWHPTRATSRRVSHWSHCRLILSRSTIWSLPCHSSSHLPLSTPDLM